MLTVVMKEPKKKLNNFLIRVLIFLIFFGMFLKGVDHFVSKLPMNMQIPVIKVKRSAVSKWSRIKLSYPRFFSDESLSQSIASLLENGNVDVLNYCRKYRDSEKLKLKHASMLCLLRVDQGETLRALVFDIANREDLGVLQEQMPNILQTNPHGEPILIEVVDKKLVSPKKLLELKIWLLQKGKGKDKWLQELRSWLDVQEHSDEKEYSLQQLSRLEPDNPKIIQYYWEKLKSRRTPLAYSLQFLANFDDKKLKEDLPKLVNELQGNDRLFVIIKVRHLCPSIDFDQWKKMFLDENQYSVKLEILKTLVSYKDFRVPANIGFYKDDLKLKPTQIEKLNKVDRNPGLVTCP